MSASALTPQTAPRDLDALKKESMFKLRLLTDQLGGFATDDQKMAWHELKTQDDRAKYVLALLQNWDSKNGGGATNAQMNGSVQVSPASTAAVNGQPASVDAASLTAAQQATAADKPKRQPRTSEATPADGAALGSDVLTGLSKVLENVTKVQAVLTENSRQASGGLSLANTTLVEIKTELAAIRKLQTIHLMAAVTFMGENMGVGIQDILSAAIADSDTLTSLIAKAEGKG